MTEDTPYGNELLLKNIDAFGQAISDHHSQIKQLSDDFREMKQTVALLESQVNQLLLEKNDG